MKAAVPKVENNMEAEAACIAREGLWFRESQLCIGGQAPNNESAEAACIARGGIWFRVTQTCMGGTNASP